MIIYINLKFESQSTHKLLVIFLNLIMITTHNRIKLRTITILSADYRTLLIDD